MRKILALDIGGTNTRAALINEDYEIESVVINPTPFGDLDAFLSNVIATAREAQKGEEIIAVSAGLPGRVRWDGYIDAMPNVGVKDVHLAETLNKEFGLPVYVRNDAEVAALAEANLGPNSKYGSLYFVTISTGVGGALTINGDLVNSSYEVGHTLFEYKGELHEFEHYASGRGLIRLARSNGLEVEGARDFFSKLEAGDPLALKIKEDWLDLLAKWINMDQENFEPEVFALTGGVMKSADLFLDELRAKCPHSILNRCHFDQQAGLIGAAVNGFHEEAKRK